MATTLMAVTAGTGVAWADPAPPPITTPPSATATQPPAGAIIDSVDPVTPCTDWYRQSAYGATWPTDATWWEYTCEFEGAVDPEGPFRTDYYYWDGTQAKSVYYGQRLLSWDWWYGSGFCLSWWDQASNQWYGPYGCALSTTPPTASFTVSCSGLSCSFDASASTDSDGTIQYYTWDFGDGTVTSLDTSTATHSYPAAGTYMVQLVVVDNNGEEAGTTQAVAVVTPANAAPTASFTATCSGLACSFDATGSADSDGTITTYGWDFGDGGSGTGATAQHSYAQPGSYPVTLTVTDNSAATATITRPVTLNALTARGYKVKVLQKVDLSWSGSGASFDVYRNGGKLTTVAGTTYTDIIGKVGAGSYTYQVCQTTTAICSNQATVTF